MVASLLSKSVSRGVLLLAALSTCTLFGAPGESNLITNSPFLPPGWGKKEPVKEEPPPVVAKGPLSRELEFRGIFEMNGVTKFSVFDKAEQKGHWVPLNGGDSKYTIVRYNEPKKSIMVKSAGRLEEIFLLAADDKPMPVVGAAATNAANRATPRGNPNIPPPPNATVNQRNTTNRSGTTVPRRRIIRRSSSGNNNTATSNSATNSNNTSTSNPQLPSNIPPPPNFTPGPPPSFTPPPPPATN
ncbi:hypothetical protein [Rubellicoccus peritrichatus]|uniref:Uncharacterized protein n=1 Tax=Rubellicoccus peritrichatus TaxID=3080537 RepID=A0AAQ3QY41_9BACT|nr:hypothetical protein [Puniceicoccus sp. CR14]WOO43682.1 hypothetical protein RZN69_11335 [Puniceicoccus sp. CR14]